MLIGAGSYPIVMTPHRTTVLLLNYHRRLRMTLEALELRVEGGRVSDSWCVCVVSHGYVGLGGRRDGGGVLHACLMSGDARAHPECEVIH